MALGSVFFNFKDIQANPLVGKKVTLTPLLTPLVEQDKTILNRGVQTVTDATGSVYLQQLVLPNLVQIDYAGRKTITYFANLPTQTNDSYPYNASTYITASSVDNGAPTDVVFKLFDNNNKPYQNIKVRLVPSQDFIPNVNSGSVVPGDFIDFSTDANGIFTASTIVPGAYDVKYYSSPNQFKGEFSIVVPANSGSINDNQIIVPTSQNQLNIGYFFPNAPAQAYTIQQALGTFQQLIQSGSYFDITVSESLVSDFAQTANVVTADFALLAGSALVVSSSVLFASSSITASVAGFASVSDTATTATQSLSASYALTASTLVAGGLLPVTSSWSLTASLALNAAGTTLNTGSSYPITASVGLDSISSSYAQFAQTTPAALPSGSTQNITSSWANNAINSNTASFLTPNQTISGSTLFKGSIDLNGLQNAGIDTSVMLGIDSSTTLVKGYTIGAGLTNVGFNLAVVSAPTASYLNATASNAVSSSFALNSATASFVKTTVASSSFSSNTYSASYVKASSVDGTVANATNASTASLANTASALTPNQTLSGSTLFKGSIDLNGLQNAGIDTSVMLGTDSATTLVKGYTIGAGLTNVGFNLAVVSAPTASFVTGSNVVGSVASSSLAKSASFIQGNSGSFAYYATNGDWVVFDGRPGVSIEQLRLKPDNGGQVNFYQLKGTSYAGSKALASSADGRIVESGTTLTELGQLSGVSSNVQTLLDNKQFTLLTGSTVPVTASHAKLVAFSGVDLTGIATSVGPAEPILLNVGGVLEQSFGSTIDGAGNITAASFIGTASYAQTASFLNATVPSSSFASKSTSSDTASFVLNSKSASFVQLAQSASVAVSSSYTLISVVATASFATTASYSNTASFANTSYTASFVSGSSVVGYVPLATFASTAQIANSLSFVPNTAKSASWATSSYSASIAQKAISSSWSDNAGNATIAQVAIVAADAVTASYAIFSQNISGSLLTGSLVPITSSWSQTASLLLGSVTSASYALFASTFPAVLTSGSTQNITSSWTLNVSAANVVGTVANATSASYATFASTFPAVLSSGSTQNITSSWTNNVSAANVIGTVTSASYSVTSSFSQNAYTASSFTLPAQISLTGLTASTAVISNAYQLNTSPSNTYTSDFTCSNSDDGKLLIVNNSSNIKMWLTGSVSNTWNSMMYQSGSGAILFNTASGVTYRNRSSSTGSAGQYSMISLFRVPNGDFSITGDTN